MTTHLWNGDPRILFGDHMQAYLCSMIYGKGRICIGIENAMYHDVAFCYETYELGLKALIAWNPEVDEEPDGWMRCPTDGRRRPNGDKTKEYVFH